MSIKPSKSQHNSKGDTGCVMKPYVSKAKTVILTRLSCLFPLFPSPHTEYFTDDSEEEDDEDVEDDDDDYEEDDKYDYELDESDGPCSSSFEESGLGLLARFAASAIPSPMVVSTPLSLIQLEAKDKAKKKQERQGLLGKWRTKELLFNKW